MEKQKLRMKDMPISELPAERYELVGAKGLSDSELLAIMLRTGTRNEKIVDVTQKILSLDKEKGLDILSSISIDELIKIKGIGKVKAIQLKCIAEISYRMARVKAKKKITCGNPESVAEYFMTDMRNMEKECIRVLLLDTGLNIISDELIGIGSVDRMIVSPVEIFQKAVLKLAKSMIIVHNHPSGSCKPSIEDIEFTTRITACGKLLGITVEDHIVIGNDSYTSIRKEHEEIFMDMKG